MTLVNLTYAWNTNDVIVWRGANPY